LAFIFKEVREEQSPAIIKVLCEYRSVFSQCDPVQEDQLTVIKESEVLFEQVENWDYKGQGDDGEGKSYSLVNVVKVGWGYLYHGVVGMGVEGLFGFLLLEWKRYGQIYRSK